MIKIVAVSDIHGNIPPDVPPCDLLLIGGDVCPMPWTLPSRTDRIWVQKEWLDEVFRPWLERQPAKHVVVVWGNHDYIGQTTHMLPKLPWTVLTDDSIEIMGLKIYGSPWQAPDFGMAYNVSEKELPAIWAKIPHNTDILLLHCPPHGYCDLTQAFFEEGKLDHAGSPSLTKRIAEVAPKLVICGHIHAGRGTANMGNTLIANVAMVNHEYKIVHQPMVFTLEDNKVEVV